jgi:hypothetical protein
MNALWDRGTVALRSGLLRVSAVLPRDLFRCGHRRWRPEMQSGQSRPRESGMSGSLGKINVVLVHEARADGPCRNETIWPLLSKGLNVLAGLAR